MLTDVRHLHSETSIDAVVFSGDLANFGQDADFALALELLLIPLERTLGLERDRFVLVPGNHDVDRDKIDEFSEKGLSELLQDRDTVNGLLAAPDKLATATARLEAWDTFRSEFYADVPGVDSVSPLAFVHVLDAPGGSLGIVALNSAWRSSSDLDHGKLLVGEAQAIPALDAISQCDTNLVAMHHPLDWLARFDADILRAQFEGRGMFVLTGHEHKPDPGSTRSARGGLIQDRTGCLYETHDYENTYSIIDVAPREPVISIYVREWYKDRSPAGVFDAATRLAENGRVDLTAANHVSHRHPPYSVVMSALTAMVRDRSVVADTADIANANGISALLVTPRLSIAPYTEARVARTLQGEPTSSIRSTRSPH